MIRVNRLRRVPTSRDIIIKLAKITGIPLRPSGVLRRKDLKDLLFWCEHARDMQTQLSKGVYNAENKDK